MNEPVECHSGFTYADRPIALSWEGRRLEITHILAEWRTPEKNHFRVLAVENQEFLLAYSYTTDTWQIEPSWRKDAGNF